MCEAFEETWREGVIATLISLVKDGLISSEVAAEEAGMTLDAFNAELAKA